ncbi:hypothetical protein Tco_1561690 [Tanacetum coccineum]
MFSPYLIVNRVGSIVPLVKPLDIKKFESTSYHALGACFNPYRGYLRRVCQRVPRLGVCQTDEALPALLLSMQKSAMCFLNVFQYQLLLNSECGDLLSIGIRNLEVDYRNYSGVKGRTYWTREVPALKNSSDKGPDRGSNSCYDGTVALMMGLGLSRMLQRHLFVTIHMNVSFGNLEVFGLKGRHPQDVLVGKGGDAELVPHRYRWPD